MTEPPRSSLYRTFLLSSVAVLLALWAVFGLHAYGVLALTWGAFLGASAAISRARARGVRVARRVASSAHEDDAVSVELTIENVGRGALSFIEVTDRFGAAIGEEHMVIEQGPLPGGYLRRNEYLAACSRSWGVYALGPIDATVPDPAGLFLGRAELGGAGMFAVYPRVYDVAGVRQLGARNSLTPQELTGARAGQSLLYLGAREYRPGDDPRKIHWRATARRGVVMVREHEVDRVPYFTLFLDLDHANRAGTGVRSTLEFVVRTAASLLATAARRGMFVQILGEASSPIVVPPGRGEAHLAAALHELIRAQQDGAVRLGEVVARSLGGVPVGSTAVLLWATSTPSPGEAEEAVAAVQARGAQVACVFVNSHSFLAMERWALKPAEVTRRRAELSWSLGSLGVPFEFLEAGDDLERRLADPGFLR